MFKINTLTAPHATHIARKLAHPVPIARQMIDKRQVSMESDIICRFIHAGCLSTQSPVCGRHVHRHRGRFGPQVHRIGVRIVIPGQESRRSRVIDVFLIWSLHEERVCHGHTDDGF